MYAVECGFVGAGDKDVRFLTEKAFDYGDDLLRPLPGRENHLGESLPQRSMVIHACETQILERQIFQSLDTLLRGEGPWRIFCKSSNTCCGVI